jgi:G protein-coupled receptor Mth (Methuselah protein)
MANSTLLFTLAYFFWHSSNETVTIQNETALEIIGDWTANQLKIEDPFITSNPADIIQDGRNLANNQEIWCCKSGTTYLPGIDQCLPIKVSTLYSKLFSNFSYPNDGLADCPDGFVSHSTKDFQLDNGTLWIGGKQLKSNEFCINRVEEENYSRSTAGNFVARYCVPDPCTTSGCIHKCCPSDMALVTKYYHDLSPILICEPYPKSLNLSLLRNPQNKSIDERAFFISGGLGIKWGDFVVKPYDVSRFSIDSDGQILYYSKDHPKGRKSDKYCIENFVDNETNVSITLKLILKPIIIINCILQFFSKIEHNGIR